MYASRVALGQSKKRMWPIHRIAVADNRNPV
jgi:hypothetical protein